MNTRTNKTSFSDDKMPYVVLTFIVAIAVYAISSLGFGDIVKTLLCIITFVYFEYKLQFVIKRYSRRVLTALMPTVLLLKIINILFY